MAGVCIRYRWRYFCPIREKMVSTKAHLTEEIIKVEHPDAEPIPGTCIEIQIPDDPMANSTSSFLRGVVDFGNGIHADKKEQ